MEKKKKNQTSEPTCQISSIFLPVIGLASGGFKVDIHLLKYPFISLLICFPLDLISSFFSHCSLLHGEEAV